MVKPQYHKKTSLPTRLRWKCSVSGCNACIHTNFDHSKLVVSGQHINKSHRLWNDQCLTKNVSLQQIKRKVRDEKISGHKAYKEISRLNPTAALVFRGWNDVKHHACKARSSTGLLLTKSGNAIKLSLIKAKLDGNFYEQAIVLKLHDKGAITE